MPSNNFLYLKKIHLWQIIFASAIIIRLFYLILTPQGQTPDEIFIFDRIWHLAINATNYPIYFQNNEYFYPPLYFVISAWIIKPLLLLKPLQTFEQAYSVYYFPLRMVSLTLSLASLILIWKTLTNLKVTETVKLSTFAFIALLPTFANFSIYLGHNVLVFFLLTSFTFLISKKGVDLNSNKTSILLGIIFGLSILTKFDSIVILPGFLFYAYLMRKNHHLLTFIAIFMFFATITGGWWYLKNYITFGWFYDKTAFEAMISNFTQPFSFEGYIPYVFSSVLITFFATFGIQNNIYLIPSGYFIFIILILLSLFGILKSKYLLSLKTIPKIYYYFLITFLTNLVLLILWNFKYVLQPQGRYLFPSIIFIALSFNIGLASVLNKRSYLLPLTIIIIGITYNIWGLSCALNSFYKIHLPLSICFRQIN